MEMSKPAQGVLTISNIPSMQHHSRFSIFVIQITTLHCCESCSCFLFCEAYKSKQGRIYYATQVSTQPPKLLSQKPGLRQRERERERVMLTDLVHSGPSVLPEHDDCEAF